MEETRVWRRGWRRRSWGPGGGGRERNTRLDLCEKNYRKKLIFVVPFAKR